MFDLAERLAGLDDGQWNFGDDDGWALGCTQ
jgi:hypothetical protein